MGTTTPSIWLTLQAHDAPALIDWYVEVLGFRVAARHDDGDLVAHAELRWPEGVGGVMLGSFVEGRPFTIAPGSANAYVVTADPDAVHARAVAAGAEVLSTPADTDFGSRQTILRDPEGNTWSFGTYPGS
ncbi:glyoxalase [Auraticoccus sp. F435]|uniref:Glyoxalase n=1 Tax=Auraticoccus cholistanensis TaxID=2656650 RepID=A0A6A9UUY4_9ACTN|nr:VOC family protein [Auraticoccus cholistanensis]MVA75384.1 glyoxalase [Auraticoccus cholistanensis]